MFVIVGLGNHGLKYRNTRHNAGFMAIDALADKLGIKISRKKFSGVIGEGRIGGEDVILLKPHTYMNLSGNSVSEIMRFYKLPPEKLIVLVDDIDLDFARLRVKRSGSAGTHNGMRSIISCLGYDNFPRVRIGIGKPPFDMLLADFVLSKFSKEDKAVFSAACERAASAAADIIENGVEHAQSEYNKK